MKVETEIDHVDWVRRKREQMYELLVLQVNVLVLRINRSDLSKSSYLKTYVVCVCVCVFSSHSFWTSSSLDVPAGVTQEEGHTGFLIHLLSAVRAFIFLARRIQPFLSLVDREVEFCVLTI